MNCLKTFFALATLLAPRVTAPDDIAMPLATILKAVHATSPFEDAAKHLQNPSFYHVDIDYAYATASTSDINVTENVSWIKHFAIISFIFIAIK
jgi:hypothetical protein